MLQCTIAGKRTKGSDEKSFVFVHQHGGYDVTWKPPIGKYFHSLSLPLTFSSAECKYISFQCRHYLTNEACRAGVFLMANICKRILFRAQVCHFKSRLVFARVADCGEGQGIQRDLFLLLPLPLFQMYDYLMGKIFF